tara:strand:+ start:882 stop:1586 length:705 start_codon:yes stop_codon:yes gene_type:complete
MSNNNKRLGVLFSSGKDSLYALHIHAEKNHEIVCLITIDSQNQDSFMFHTPTIELAKHQADSLGIPIITSVTHGKEEIELEDLKDALKTAKEKYKLDGIVTGALHSSYQKTRIDNICKELELECHSPLWHMDQEQEMRELLAKRFKFVMSKVAAEGLDKSWLGEVITLEHLDKIVELNKKLAVNVAGEGGEFETFVLDAPMFKKELRIKKSRINEESDGSATLLIDEIESLTKK